MIDRSDWKIVKGLYILLPLVFTIGFVPILNNVNAQDRPKIYVDPIENTFFTDTTSVGATFTVSIKAVDWVDPGVFSYQFTFQYDPTMLEATAAEIPEGHWLTPTIKPANIFVVDSGTIDTVAGTVSFSVTLLSPELGKTGGGTIATVTLKIIAAPAAGQTLTCSLGFKEVIMVNPDAAEIPKTDYDVVSGTYLYLTPPPPWYFKIEPEIIAVYALGDEGVVTVSLHDAQAEARIVGVQFKIVLPLILWTQEEWISTFVSEDWQLFEAIVERDAEGHLVVIVWMLMLPNPMGVWDRFFEGNVSLANMRFKVVSLPENVTKFSLCLSDVMMADSDANSVPFRSSECAVVIAPAKPEDLNVDLRVNIKDLALFAVAFGSTPTSSRWNPKADVNRDGKVNILDGVLIAKVFGWMLADPP